jgi:RNA polymerase sigma-70 factor (ECF subfamily)
MQNAATDASEKFQNLLEANRRIVLKVAYAYGRLPEDRRDLSQEICLQLWTSFPKYDAQRSFTTWMYRIALNVAISYARHAGLRERRSVPLDAPIQATLAAGGDTKSDQVRSLIGFIEQMDELNRALMLLYLEEHSYEEIAEIMGLTKTNVATKISRLKQRIREELA